jgi:hypothetical protein
MQQAMYCRSRKNKILFPLYVYTTQYVDEFYE